MKNLIFLRRAENGTIDWTSFDAFLVLVGETSSYRCAIYSYDQMEWKEKEKKLFSIVWLFYVRTHVHRSFQFSIGHFSMSCVCAQAARTSLYSPPDIRSNANDNVAHKKMWMNYGKCNSLSIDVMIHSLALCDAHTLEYVHCTFIHTPIESHQKSVCFNEHRKSN